MRLSGHRRFLYGAIVAGGMIVLNATGTAAAADLPFTPFGTTTDGQEVRQYALTNNHGVTVKFLNYGGVITEIDTPDRTGAIADIALGFKTLKEYETGGATIYFGALVGRYANRIGGAGFTLDGHEYRLAANNGPNTLHGGIKGFDKRIWQVEPGNIGDGASAVLTYVSKDGEENFPGTLTVHVTYRLTDDALHITYRATTDKDTVLNLTNHTYWNLAGNGSGSVADQLMQINADRYTPIDASLIPTGELAPVAGTPLDFRQPTPIGARIRAPFPQMLYAHGYDHNFVLNKDAPDTLSLAARAHDPKTGRILEVLTTQPGLQLYTGNFLDGSVVGSAGATYRQTDGFALETQHFPDSPNKPAFPTTELKPGQTFHSETVFRFLTDSR